MERLIYEYMLAIGLKPQSMGYKYIYDLINMSLSGFDILPLKQNGYKCLSDRYHKTQWSIDKNIQNCISKAWLEGDIEYLYKEFGNTIDMEKGKPTAKQLIMHIRDKILMKIC